jgi:CheY-like chemotaxis protein
VLGRLKHDLSVRHIPVYIVSTVDQPEHGLKLGARGVLQKPIQTSATLETFLLNVRDFVDREARRIIVVESDAHRRERLVRLLESPHVEVVAAETGAAALEGISSGSADCVVLTPDPVDMTLATLAEQMTVRPDAEGRQALLYFESDPTSEGRQRLMHLAKEFNLTFVDRPEDLVDQAAVATCQPTSALPEEQQRMVRAADASSTTLRGKKVLIVDDDIRNIFALTSILERYDMVTVSAETGRDAINLLQASPDIDIVLMDIMMPEMDGIDTMRAIRKISRFKNLPIVAVTAKAMKGDREKCIEAGAWDYLSKPVDSEQMLAALRAWLTT